jgi:Uncharacterized protein conserved in bacteria
MPNAYLSGATIDSRDGEITLVGDADMGRSQMILLQTGGLGLSGKKNLSSETIVLANSIKMLQTEQSNEFYFSGQVDVMSGGVQVQSDRMKILAAASGESAAVGDSVAVGELQQMLAEGAVRVQNGEQVATGEQVEFFPKSQRAVLTGNPRIQSGETIVDGLRMELESAHSIITGSDETPVVVSLPAMPDMGFNPSIDLPEPKIESDSGTKTEAGEEVSAVEPSPTVIKSRRLELFEEQAASRFEFSKSVEVLATNLVANCERMEVLTKEVDASGSTAELERIDAYDSVRIEQSGRVATAGKATILPEEGKLILEEKAVVEDDRGRVSGHRLTLLQGERRAIVEGGGADGDRARITLPEIPNKEL